MLAPQIMSTEVTLEKLKEIVCTKGAPSKSGISWKYMGTENSYDYLITFNFLEARETYRIPHGKLTLIEAYPFTTSQEKWESIVSFYHLNKHTNIVHPQLTCINIKGMHKPDLYFIGEDYKLNIKAPN